jgi:GNAT superfamily N-acetyltransferase
VSRRASVRSATPADVPVILALIRELAVYEKLEHLVAAKEEDLDKALFAERSVVEALIASLDDEPVGFALFFPNFSTFLGKPGLYLEDLYVRPEARGAGLGRMLLEHLAALAVDRGWGRMEWSVLDWNQPAIEFYKKMGATPMDEWTTFRVTGEQLKKLALAD